MLLFYVYKINGIYSIQLVLSNYVGTQDFDIGKALGHSTPSTTKKIYTHLFDEKQTDAMNAVADIIEKIKTFQRNH